MRWRTAGHGENPWFHPRDRVPVVAAAASCSNRWPPEQSLHPPWVDRCAASERPLESCVFVGGEVARVLLTDRACSRGSGNDLKGHRDNGLSSVIATVTGFLSSFARLEGFSRLLGGSSHRHAAATASMAIRSVFSFEILIWLCISAHGHAPRQYRREPFLHLDKIMLSVGFRVSEPGRERVSRRRWTVGVRAECCRKRWCSRRSPDQKWSRVLPSRRA